MAWLAGSGLSWLTAARRPLDRATEDWIPDGTPGAIPVQGLFIKTGRGALGWIMAASSGGLMTDLVTGRKPHIVLGGPGIECH